MDLESSNDDPNLLFVLCHRSQSARQGSHPPRVVGRDTAPTCRLVASRRVLLVATRRCRCATLAWLFDRRNVRIRRDVLRRAVSHQRVSYATLGPVNSTCLIDTSTTMTRLLLFPGMTPNPEVFSEQVAALPNTTIAEYIAPEPREPLTRYADRMATHLESHSPDFVGGLSFGGIIGLEVACRLDVRGCFLISSVRCPSELPLRFRLLRSSRHPNFERMFARVGAMSVVASRIARIRALARLAKFAGEEGHWHRWASSAVLNWTPHPKIDSICVSRIHGDCDRTFPIRNLQGPVDVAVRGGGHVLPMTHPQKVTDFMQSRMSGS